MKPCPFCGCDVIYRHRFDSHIEYDKNGRPSIIEKPIHNGQMFCMVCDGCKTRMAVPIEGLMEIGGDGWDGTDEGLWGIMESLWDTRYSD